MFGKMVLLACAGLTQEASGSGPIRYVFPKDACVLDAKRDLGAKGDGVADDTAALQRGLDQEDAEPAKLTKLVYLPKGTYRVTKTLVVKRAIGPWLYGETRDGVVIKLDDNVKNVTAVLRTHPNEKGPTSADWFMRNIRNLTIDVGINPDTDGVRYYATNTGMLKNVRVIGKGKIGINAGFLDQSGPNLIQDCEVDGFETGLLSQWIWGETLSRVTLKNCRKVGLVISANSVAAEDLTIVNCPLAIDVQQPEDWSHWSGVLALVGGRLEAAGFAGPAIRNRGVLYARNVAVVGYKASIDGATPEQSVSGLGVSEYFSHPVVSAFAKPSNHQPLTIKSEPTIAWETDRSKWVCANDFGAKPGDNQDDTQAIQAAVDAAAKAGQTTVYFRGCGGPDPQWHNVEGEIRVHGSVRRVMGLGWARLLGAKHGKFVVDDSSAEAVHFQNIDSFGGPPVVLENRSKSRSLVVESCGVRIVGAGQGDIFASDCPCLIELNQPGQRLWGRGLNPEGDSDVGLVRSNGGLLWMLGMKFEGRGVRVRTTNRGQTEIFGVFNYGPGIKEEDHRPMFDVVDSALAIHGLRELSFGGLCFRTKVREQQGSVQKSLTDESAPGWIGWSAYRSGTEAK